MLIPWELSRRSPLIDMRMLATRQFGACFIVMGATGAILLATTNFLPQLTQEDFGYTATWAGLALSPGGLVTVGAMIAVGQLSGRVQPKYLIATGAAICAASMYWLTDINSDVGFWFFAETRMLIGLGLPLIFIPIIAASYDGLKPSQTDQASALLNAARNTGGSIGVSLASNVLAHRQQFHQSRLAESTIPSSIPYQNAVNQATHYFAGAGRLAAAGEVAGVRLDRPAGHAAVVAARLCRRVLGADVDGARRDPARADAAQREDRPPRRPALTDRRRAR